MKTIFVTGTIIAIFVISCNLAGNIDQTYTVTFNTGGGTPPTFQQIVNNGGKVTKPADPEKIGYTLEGWYKEAVCINTWDFLNDTVTTNITLYANWNINNFKIIYNANGGTGVMGDSDFIYGISQNLRLNTFSKANYVFIGWSREASGPVHFLNGEDISNLTVTNNTTIILYAQWGAVYYIEYNSNGGTGIIEQTIHTYGIPQNLRINTFTRTNYVFAGWARTETGTVEFLDGVAIINLTTNGGATVTLYAVWAAVYSVEYNPNGGLGTMEKTMHTYGIPQNLRQNTFTRNGFNFSGWARTETGTLVFTDTESVNSLTTVGGETVTLYAVWQSSIVSGTSLVAKLTWLESNAISNGNYIIEINTNENISPKNIFFSGKNGITITLRGIGAIRTIGLLNAGSLFSIYTGVTLVLDNNIILRGLNNNTASLVYVSSGCSLIMNTGSTITGNTYYVSSPTGNCEAYGGGVYVDEGTFIMNGGTISNNTASAYSSYYPDAYGGGVYVSGGNFTMNGGTITGNTSYSYSHSNSFSYGGGVYIFNGTFNMNGGTISANTVSASSSSEPVYAYSFGGGVYLSGGTFNKTGGIIYGYSSGDNNSNTVRHNNTNNVINNRGYAVYAFGNGITKRKETTAGTGVNLFFNNGVFSGSWDF